MSYPQLKYVHGSLLTQICIKIGITPTRAHKDAIKAMLKKARGVESLGGLDNSGLRFFIEQSAILLATEFAIVVDFPGEIGVEEQDMKNFFKTVYHNDRRTETANEDSSETGDIHE